MEKLIYLRENIFKWLKNLNNGFDSSSIYYFSESDFKIVLNRVENYKLGVLWIEPWKNRKFYWILTCEEFNMKASNSIWYKKAFEIFKKQDKDLLYAASYDIPTSILKHKW